MTILSLPILEKVEKLRHSLGRPSRSDFVQCLFDEIFYAVNDEGCSDVSELSDYWGVYLYNADSDTYEYIQFNEITSIVPVNSEISNEYLGLWSFEQISDAFNYPCDASGVISMVEAIDISADSLKLWRVTNKKEISISPTTATDIISCLKNEFGIEAYDAFIKYIKDNFVTYNDKVTSINVNDVSQKNESVDVYADELKVSLGLLETNELGYKNNITQLWYAGNLINYLLPEKNSYNYEGEMLYHGKIIKYGYNKLDVGSNFGYVDGLEKMYHLKYNEEYSEELWNTALGTVVFAKVPSQIDKQDEIVTDETEYKIKWETPSDNGAEILGYQIAVVPRGSKEPSDNQYITVGDRAGSYTDLGDIYEIKYTTANNFYTVETKGESVDVYVRAVNVIGAAKPQKFSITNMYDISISGPESVKTGDTGNYDTLNIEGVNVETSCEYELQDSPAGISISTDGTLSVADSCTLKEVTIVVKGKEGTDYEGKQDSMTVAIIASTVNPGTNPNPDTNPNPETEPNPNPNPDAGSDFSVYMSILTILTVLSLGAVMANIRKRYLFKINK